MNQYNDQLPVGLLAQLVRVLHRDRRSQGLNPGKPDFFQAFFSQLHKLHLQLWCSLHLLGPWHCHTSPQLENTHVFVFYLLTKNCNLFTVIDYSPLTISLLNLFNQSLIIILTLSFPPNWNLVSIILLWYSLTLFVGECSNASCLVF